MNSQRLSNHYENPFACASGLTSNLLIGIVAKATRAITFKVISTFEKSLNRPNKIGADAPPPIASV